MRELPFVPNQISHRELDNLLNAASKDIRSANKADNNTTPQEVEDFYKLLETWGDMSKKINEAIASNRSVILDNLKSNQAMALGAFNVHLSLALQAKTVITENN